MKIHEVKRNTKLKRSRLIGRGGKRGKTSGKGTKGQKARAGRKLYPELRDIIKKIPKLRGHGKNYNTSVKLPAKVISLSIIESNYKDGEIVSAGTLFEKGLIRKVAGKFPKVKIVAGELKNKVVFTGVSMSESVKKAVEVVSEKKK
jgi:large subunit ribosomal protein L15